MTSFWLPVGCVICGEPPVSLCQSCISGLRIESAAAVRPGLVHGIACSYYEDKIQELLHAFKRTGSMALANYMAKPLAEALVQSGIEGPLILVPVPSRREATAVRGFVPATVLAKAVARRLRRRHKIRARVLQLALIKAKVADQAGLNRQARAQNLAGKFVCKMAPTPALAAANLLMLDDIITTGATLQELQRCLKSAGWNPLSFLTFSETLQKR